jgi:FKBP-type peptidyl-prolyl cis-trans isomerase 2
VRIFFGTHFSTGTFINNFVPGKEIMAIENGKKVTFHYTLTVDDQVIQTSKGNQPLAYTHGSGEIISGLALEMEGMNEGEEKSVLVSAENAYGEVNPEAFKEVPRSTLPAEMEINKGMTLRAQSPEGKEVLVRVSDVKEDSIIINLNHPLAGKDLKFDVKVVSIE